MKRSPVLLLLSCLKAYLWLAIPGAVAQPSLLDQRVSVNCQHQPIAQVLDDLQRRYQIPFAWFGQSAAFTQQVTLELREQPLRKVLDTLLSRTEITYEWVVSQIVLKASKSSGYLTVRGRVVEQATGNPIPFAAIRLQRGAAGTIANEGGKFSFHFPDTLAADTLVISRLGYRNYSAPAAPVVKQKESLFALHQDTVQLAEITIRGAPLTAAQLVDSAVARIEFNYPSEPCNLHLFYRETLKEAGSFVSLSEAAAFLYDEKGYQKPKGRFISEKVKLLKARGIRYQPGAGPNQWVNHLSATLEHNAVKYREALRNRRHAHYELLPDELWNGTPVHVVTAANPRYQVTIWIGTESFAIVRYVLESQPAAAFISGTEQKDSDSTFTAATLNRVINEFREYKGKWYPQYLQWTYEHQRFHQKSGLPLPSPGQHRRMDLLVNEVITDAVQPIPKNEEMNGRVPVAWQDEEYDPQFWNTCNQLLPLESQISRDLEKESTLEDQFGQDLPPAVRKKLRQTSRKK